MKPYKSEHGESGVLFESTLEIDTVASGLELLIDLAGKPVRKDDRDLQEVIKLAGLARFLLETDYDLTNKALAAGRPEALSETDPLVWEVSGEQQLRLARLALETATVYPDPLLCITAETILADFNGIAPVWQKNA